MRVGAGRAVETQGNGSVLATEGAVETRRKSHCLGRRRQRKRRRGGTSKSVKPGSKTLVLFWTYWAPISVSYMRLSDCRDSSRGSYSCSSVLNRDCSYKPYSRRREQRSEHTSLLSCPHYCPPLFPLLLLSAPSVLLIAALLSPSAPCRGQRSEQRSMERHWLQ